jgi:hypothetical protein
VSLVKEYRGINKRLFELIRLSGILVFVPSGAWAQDIFKFKYP